MTPKPKANDLSGSPLNDQWDNWGWYDQNQLTAVTVSDARRSDFQYDGKMRRRVRSDYTWSGAAWVKTNIVRYIYDGKLDIQERWFDPEAG